MTLKQFLIEIQNSATEKFAVVYHGPGGLAGFEIISHGDFESVKFNPQAVFDKAKLYCADAFTLIHNHPTGDVRPSGKDLLATFTVQDLAKDAGLKLRDHVILGPNDSPYSFAQNGAI